MNKFLAEGVFFGFWLVGGFCGFGGFRRLCVFLMWFFEFWVFSRIVERVGFEKEIGRGRFLNEVRVWSRVFVELGGSEFLAF